MIYNDKRIKADFKDRLKMAMKINEFKAIDLCRLTGIPKSTMSQYLSGRNEAKADKVHILAKCLNVNEAWLIGYDIPMERTETQKRNDQLVNLVSRMRNDEEFTEVVRMLDELQPEQYNSIKQLLSTLTKK